MVERWSYEETKQLSDAAILTKLIIKYPGFQLYQMSTDWRDDNKYILKAKGAFGDVIVTWKER